MKHSRNRRFWKTPQVLLDAFERLILTTDYPASKCAEIAGVYLGAYSLARQILKRHRQHIGNGLWIDLATGQVRPAMCTSVCAAEKVGLSVRTIGRRIAAGDVAPEHAMSNAMLRVFTPSDIEVLRRVGRKYSDPSVLSEDDVLAIRALAASGVGQAAIANQYPVTRRQINRIVNGKQWKRVERKAS